MSGVLVSAHRKQYTRTQYTVEVHSFVDGNVGDLLETHDVRRGLLANFRNKLVENLSEAHDTVVALPLPKEAK
jgi:hypothetical protein